MAYRGGDGYTSRGGLNARSNLLGSGSSDQVQIHIDPGAKFDFEAQVQDLRQGVRKIKELAYAIDDERKLQGQEINALEEALEKARLMMKTATRRLNVVYKQSRSNFMLYVVLFAVLMFVGVYMLAKLYRIGRRLGGG